MSYRRFNAFRRTFATAGLLLCVSVTPAAQVPAAEVPDMPALLEQYKQFRLPLPPSGSVLVRRPAARRFGRDGQPVPQMYGIAFRLPGGSKLLWGIRLISEADTGNVSWDPVRPDAVDPGALEVSPRGPVFGADDALATAIQCESMGLHSLGLAIVERAPSAFVQRQDMIFRKTIVFGPTDLSPQARVAYFAWAYWCNMLVEPDSPREVVARRMEALIAAEPRLRKDEQKTALLDSLKAALRPSTAAPGSIDARIDQLVYVDKDPIRTDLGGIWGDSRFMAVAMQGFAAVPALINHLDDQLSHFDAKDVSRLKATRAQNGH